MQNQISTADRMHLQEWLARSRGWIGIVILAPFCIAVFYSVPRSVLGNWEGFVFEQIGWLLFMAGAAIRWWSTLYIGGRKTGVLITQGPYSLCRNPLYVATFLMVLSIAAFLESATFALGLLLASSIYLSATVAVEERRLLQLYGDEYLNYCREVPRFWPRFSHFRSPESIEVRVGGLLSESLRAARWIWLPIICQFVVQLRSQPNWPHLFRLP